MNRLQGKHILITGASQGLGRELALAFAREGASALALVARDSVALEAVKAEVRELAPDAQLLVIAADLSRQEEIERRRPRMTVVFNTSVLIDILRNARFAKLAR